MRASYIPTSDGHARPATLPQPRHPLSLLRALWRLLLIWQKRAADRRRLATLDPHLQRDIGLHDAEIAREVRKPFWRE